MVRGAGGFRKGHSRVVSIFVCCLRGGRKGDGVRGGVGDFLSWRLHGRGRREEGVER